MKHMKTIFEMTGDKSKEPGCGLRFSRNISQYWRQSFPLQAAVVLLYNEIGLHGETAGGVELWMLLFPAMFAGLLPLQSSHMHAAKVPLLNFKSMLHTHG